MLDLRGTTIAINDELAYAQRDGNSSRMRLYRVLEVDAGARTVKAMPIDGITTRSTTLIAAYSNGVIVKKAEA